MSTWEEISKPRPLEEPLPTVVPLIAEPTLPVISGVPVGVVTVDQPSKQPSPKMTSVGLGGVSTGGLLLWLKARFDLNITMEDVALFLPVLCFVVGYITKDRVDLSRFLRK
jgi:hypothetical protein